MRGGPTATLGIVSGLGRTIKTEQGQQFFNLIQTDATINTGNSGGPLVDMNGTVIGINQAVLAEARFGFAINAAVAGPVIESLIEDGMVSRVEIGIKGDDVYSRDSPVVQPVGDGGRLSLRLSPRMGRHTWQASGSGTSSRSLTTSPTPDLATFLPRLWAYKPGDEIVIEYVDGDSTKITTVTVESDLAHR